MLLSTSLFITAGYGQLYAIIAAVNIEPSPVRELNHDFALRMACNSGYDFTLEQFGSTLSFRIQVHNLLRHPSREAA